MKTCRGTFLVLSMLVTSAAWGQEPSETELAKQSQNPVSSIISVPFEYWTHGAENGTINALLVKPVIPVQFGKFKLINRFIIPYAWIDPDVKPDIPIGPTAPAGPFGDLGVNGLGDATYQTFLAPVSASKVIWGAGFALTAPLGSDQISANRWSAGPSLLVLVKPGNWVMGALFQNVWDFAGSGETSVNRMTLQPAVNYNFGQGWYAFSAPIITANWEDEEKWTVPVGAGVGKLQRLGKLPVDFKLAYYYNVERPTHAPDWSLLFAVKFLLPGIGS